MSTHPTRRRFLKATAAASAAPFALGFPLIAQSQDGTSVTLRIPDDIANIDPAYRIGPVEDNVLSAVCQRPLSFPGGRATYVRRAR